uniref:Uncharacterized protein n=1 Tax=Arundo donax TaxID=35708 RepID=A0A0A9GSC1_ARUDO
MTTTIHINHILPSAHTYIWIFVLYKTCLVSTSKCRFNPVKFENVLLLCCVTPFHVLFH